MQTRMVTTGRVTLVLGLLVSTLAACNRDAVPMTQCIGDKPAIERIEDVAPPNCPN